MNNKYFKVSYQGVKEFVNVIVFVIFMWYISSKLLVLISEPKWFESFLVAMGITSPVTLMAYLVVGAAIIWLLYYISAAMVSLAYWMFAYRLSESRWYGSLTESSIRVPLTKNKYWAIKDNPKFMKIYPGQTKAEFVWAQLDKWAAEIIEKELDRLIEGGKTK